MDGDASLPSCGQVLLPGSRERSAPIACTDRGPAVNVLFNGRLLHIHVAPAASYEMEELEEANLVAGRGIEGDRYFLGTGTYSAKPDFREVTLIEIEALQALARNDPPCNPDPSLLRQPTIAEI